jgi:hypothetical protein
VVGGERNGRGKGDGRSGWWRGGGGGLGHALQRQNAENLKQIFSGKEYRGLSPNFYIHVSVSEL